MNDNIAKFDFDVCTELVKIMENMGFKETSINYIKSHRQFTGALSTNPVMQKTMLTMLFYDLFAFNRKGEIVPGKIRSAINYSQSVAGWFDEVRLVALPFLKENEEHFF